VGDVRDKVAVGALDGAHMLAPMAWRRTATAAPRCWRPLALNQNGSAITVSDQAGRALREVDPEAMAAPLITAAPLARLVGGSGKSGARRC
jgi:ABC-type nitrate/sulfonate/bicarbonate transport system substrate-binding protein